MKARRAIVAIAPDQRQEMFLSRVLPGWQSYARRHRLEIVIVRRSITNGRHPYWDRWLTIQEGVPETTAFDEFLLLDNDIFISDTAPNVFAEWDRDKINVVEESAQGDWKRDEIPSYYESFHVTPNERLPQPAKVFNMGVCLLSRRRNETLRLLYQKWLAEIQPRFSDREREGKNAFFRIEADGPFLSYELQAMDLIAPLRKEFNYFLVSWLRSNRVRELPFLIQGKIAQKLTGKAPELLIKIATSPARASLRHAVHECHFLHVAASKSPLWLLPSLAKEDSAQAKD